MNFSLYIAKKIIKRDALTGKYNLSRPAINVATLGVILGMAVMIVTLAIVIGFKREIREKVIGFESHIQVTKFDANTSFEPNPISAKQPFLKQLSSLPGFHHIQVYATKNGIIRTKTETEGILLKGIGTDYDWSFIQKHLKEGKTFIITDTAPAKDIIISRYLARRLALKLNDRLTVFFVTKSKSKDEDERYAGYEQRARNFYISGIYETGFEEFDKKTVVIDIAHIRQLNYWEKDEVGGFEITLNDFEKADGMSDEVNDLIGQDLVANTIRQMNPTIFSWLDLQDVNATIVITLMIFVAGINMVAAFLILVLERTSMIGILKAMGAGNRSIRNIFLYHAAFLLGKGLLWGNVLGLGLCIIQQKFKLITLPQESYYLSSVPIEINWFYIAVLNVGAIVICLVLLLLPSMVISRVTPVKAIRFS